MTTVTSSEEVGAITCASHAMARISSMKGSCVRVVAMPSHRKGNSCHLRKGKSSHPFGGLLATARVDRLLGETDWEKTARGTTGRRWPWGSEDDYLRVNVMETKVGATSAVGKFGLGASPEGI